MSWTVMAAVAAGGVGIAAACVFAWLMLWSSGR